MRNPYRHDLRDVDPSVEIPRSALLSHAAAAVQGGGIAYLLGGRGMGKSVFLRQLERTLSAQGVRVVLLSGPAETLERTLQRLARRLELGTDPGFIDAEEILERHLGSTTGNLALLFDELDRYAARDADQGRALFNTLEAVRQHAGGRLGLFAAGGLGFFLLKDQLGSNFLSRAERLLLKPFGAEELRQLARPFAAAGEPLDEDLLEVLRLQSGGNPLLSTYALEQLFGGPQADVGRLTQVFAQFRERKPDFLPEFWKAITDSHLADVPRALLARVQRDGVLLGAARDEIFQGAPAAINLRDAVDLLQAAGLVHVDGALEDEPALIRPVAGLMNLPATQRFSGALPERLLHDLGRILCRLHALGVDFYRSGTSRGERQLVPEANIAAFLGLGLGLLGWQVAREAQQGSGRTDLLLRWRGTEQTALIEVKIWGRNDYEDVQAQVERYWAAPEISAAAVVMLAERRPKEWPVLYRQRCLVREDLDVTERGAEPPLHRFTVRSRGAAGFPVQAEHLLLSLDR